MAEVTTRNRSGRQQKGLYKISVDSEIVDTYFRYDGNYIIYGLASSEEPTRIRYVGYTSMGANLRCSHHRNYVNRDNSDKDQWLKELFNQGQNFIFILLQEDISDEAEAEKQEKYYIQLYREKDPELLNRTDGGKGTTGFHHSDATKEKMSKANKGKPYKKGPPLPLRIRLRLRKLAQRRRQIAKERGLKCN